MDEFSKKIKEQGIEGIDVPRINASDLLGMGIINFRDRKDLEKYFADLANDEGSVTQFH